MWEIPTTQSIDISFRLFRGGAEKSSERSLRCLVVKKDQYGKIIGHEFRPTHLMRLMLYESNDPKNSHLEMKEIFKRRGIAFTVFKNWQKDFVEVNEETLHTINFFQEWWDEQVSLFSMDPKAALRHIGMQHALEGKFSFWKEMSRTEGVISAEEVNHNIRVIPMELGKNDATIEDIRSAKRKLLDAQRGMGDRGGDQVAAQTPDGPKGPTS